jgi:CDGSH-type Zn-finger protein
MSEQTDGVVIRILDNGPYRVEGPARIIDADGNEHDVSARKRVSLCRCGGSTTKPFCDGTHSKLGFAAAERAVAEADDAPAG